MISHFESACKCKHQTVNTFRCVSFCLFLPGLPETEYQLKGTVNFKEQNGKYFKAFNNNNIYIYIISHIKWISIYFCVLNGGGAFYKHSEKCLHEMTIVPQGIIMSQSVAISFSRPPLPLFFSELLELERRARCWHRIALIPQGSDFVVVSNVSLCLIPLSRPAPTYRRSSSSLARVRSTWAACTALPDVVMEHARSPLRTTDEENANNQWGLLESGCQWL